MRNTSASLAELHQDRMGRRVLEGEADAALAPVRVLHDREEGAVGRRWLRMPRWASPDTACSTLMTSAPQSAITAPAEGVNVNWATSTIFTPFIG